MKRGDDGIMKMPSNMKADFAEAMLTKQLNRCWYRSKNN